MLEVTHLSMDELVAGLEAIRQAPKDQGVLEMIVRRPDVDLREVLDVGALDRAEGLVGDSWKRRGSTRMPDGAAHPDMQINVMNARVIALVAGSRQRWQLAGDQLFIDMDISMENLPPWTRLGLGTAVIEVTDQPHTGCEKFMSRFGKDALKFVNSPEGKRLRLRGMNTRVVQAGLIHVGDTVRKL
jgi:hypothetical protein